jgi:2-dehydro-3-deoxyphosphogluconate aldolase/(4S)-4-hydroxy-2-oxoglutarate aldolase
VQETLAQKFAKLAIIPVAAINDAKHSIALGQALSDGGLPCLEVTFRTSAAIKVIETLSKKREDILVGAGTVINPDQAKEAVNAGARFIVSPGIHIKVVEWCLSNGVPVFPGVATASDIAVALDYGLLYLKFFPAEILGGVRALKALSAPYGMIKFIPTGGLNLGNLEEYLMCPSVLACGGSWIVKKELIELGKYDEISQLAGEAVRLVNRIRGLRKDEP